MQFSFACDYSRLFGSVTSFFNMRLLDFDYQLPAELIAAEPVEDRAASRMLIVERGQNTFRDSRFSEFPLLLKRGDLVVLNNTKVFPARLFGITETGGKMEIFLIREAGNKVWHALARPARRLKAGKKIWFADDLSARVLELNADGEVSIEFDCEGEFDAAIDRIGRTPLPPYIKRDRDAPDTDRERYQTVYARRRGAIAAPTAGLHFTASILEEIRSRGIRVAEITLHVGYGTFEPVRVDDLARHSVMPEQFEIESDAADELTSAKRDGRRIIAIGTTTTRALETLAAKTGGFPCGSGIADLTIRPGYQFRAVDALLTNFHLPQSSLLILVSTFGGHQLIMGAYKHAVAEKYRFYSYGDCMLLI